MVVMVRRRIIARPARSSAHSAACSEVSVYACYAQGADDFEIQGAVSRAYMRAAKRVFPGTTTLRVASAPPGLAAASGVGRPAGAPTRSASAEAATPVGAKGRRATAPGA